MALDNIIKLTESQYNTLSQGGTVGSETGLKQNTIYLVEKTVSTIIYPNTLSTSSSSWNTKSLSSGQSFANYTHILFRVYNSITYGAACLLIPTYSFSQFINSSNCISLPVPTSDSAVKFIQIYYSSTTTFSVLNNSTQMFIEVYGVNM